MPPLSDLDIEPEVSLIDASQTRGAPLHWFIKLCVKLAIARVSAPYQFWRRIGIFRHGSPKEQFRTARHRLQLALDFHAKHGIGAVKRVLELGPGDSLALAIPAMAQGMSCDFVDVGDFAAYLAKDYAGLAAQCEEEFGARPFTGVDFKTRESLLKCVGASYGTDGLQSLRKLSDDSIDVSLSTVVLEHVRIDEFDETFTELFRVTRPGGTGRHFVDVTDHLGGRLNNLRFPREMWESRLMASSGFYTNRLRPSQIIQRAKDVGFQTATIRMQRFPIIPTPKKHMSKEFLDRPDEDFEIATFELALRKP